MINVFAPSSNFDLMVLGKKSGPNGPEEIRFRVNSQGTVEMYNVSGPAMIAYDSNGDKILQLNDDGLLRTREVKVDNHHAVFVFGTTKYLQPLCPCQKQPFTRISEGGFNRKKRFEFGQYPETPNGKN